MVPSSSAARVPVHPSTVEVLADYNARREVLLGREAVEAAFFVSLKGKRLLRSVVDKKFRKLCQGAGIGVGSSSRPRIHDLRHTFAVTVLLEWYRTGQDVAAALPRLSTYLGHREPSSTYWYLSTVPELLAVAAQRLGPLPGKAVSRWP